jgi:hypothetical protein
LGWRILGWLGLGLLSLSALAQSRPMLRLDLLTGGSDFDQTYIYFEQGATTGFDVAFDATKLPNSSGLNLASFEAGGQQLAINGLPPAVLSNPFALPLFVGVPAYGTYQLQVSQLDDFATASVYLTDALLGTSTPLALGTTYTIELTAANTSGTYATSTRFALQFGPGAAPLPVVLTFFTAAAQPAGTQLMWGTASETNSAFFAIERSLDGRTFSELGRVAAAGTSAGAHRYSWLEAGLVAVVGPRYYRLRQVDHDGTTTYSPVRTVAGAASELTLFPNPALGVATLRGTAAGAVVEVLDALGRERLRTTADAAGTAQLGLPPGVYVVRTGGHSLRLLVQ